MAKAELDYNQIGKASELLKGMAHPLRLKAVSALTRTNELNVSQLVFELKAEQSLVSHHLAKMLECGVLKIRRDGKHIYYSLTDKSLAKIVKNIAKCKQLK